MADTCTETSVPIEYQGEGSFFGGETPLPLGIGYAIVLGFGVFFTLLTLFLVWLEKRSVIHAEMLFAVLISFSPSGCSGL